MRIGELTRSAGVTRKAVRYYEGRGLLPSRRTAAGYRDFDARAIEIVRTIRAGQHLGLRLDDLRDVLAIVARGDLPCNELLGLIDKKRAAIRAYINELRAFDDYLAALCAPLEGDATSPCPIVAKVSETDSK
jgi:DNA-binding transcriptional MerR regulator